MTDPTLRDRATHLVPAVLVGFGAFLFASLIGMILLSTGYESLFHPLNVAGLGITLVLSAAVAGSGVLLARGELPASRYGRVVFWCFGGGAAFLALNLPTLVFFPGLNLTAELRFAHYYIATGAAGGSVAGLIESRAIDRARRAERSAVRADQAEATAERLDRLNSFLRHEVLNDVAVIQGNAELALEEGENVSGELHDYLTTIQRKSDETASLVRDARVLVHAFQPTESLEPTDLTGLLESELEGLQDIHDSVEFTADLPDYVPVMADSLLRHLFWNLLSNAVEHNDSPTPRIDLSVELAAETVSVRIADNGPGIPEHERERLFERAKEGDHGIGLFIVKTLADRYDARVELVETGPEGTVFVVELPRAEGDSPVPPLTTADERTDGRGKTADAGKPTN